MKHRDWQLLKFPPWRWRMLRHTNLNLKEATREQLHTTASDGPLARTSMSDWSKLRTLGLGVVGEEEQGA